MKGHAREYVRGECIKSECDQTRRFFKGDEICPREHRLTPKVIPGVPNVNDWVKRAILLISLNICSAYPKAALVHVKA